MSDIANWEGILLHIFKHHLGHVESVSINPATMEAWAVVSPSFQIRSNILKMKMDFIKKDARKVGLQIWSLDFYYDKDGLALVFDMMKPLSNPPPKHRYKEALA